MGEDGVGTVIKLRPVMNGSNENIKFYKYSPSGSIELGTVNEGAAAQFEISKEYYVDFVPTAWCVNKSSARSVRGM